MTDTSELTGMPELEGDLFWRVTETWINNWAEDPRGNLRQTGNYRFVIQIVSPYKYTTTTKRFLRKSVVKTEDTTRVITYAVIETPAGFLTESAVRKAAETLADQRAKQLIGLRENARLMGDYPPKVLGK